MSSKKILYVTHEITPFLEETQVAHFVMILAKQMQEDDLDVRILMPRFGLINERKNRLHEVKRLSRANISIGAEERVLTIKVASIPNARLQVYFIENDDYFKVRKSVFHDKEGNFYGDNHERMLFFCQGVLMTVKQLGWVPDIVHCFDWMSSMVPLFLKTTYKTEPVFQDAKVVFSLPNPSFKEKLTSEFSDILTQYKMPKEAIEMSKTLDYQALINIAAQYSDLLTGADDESITLLKNTQSNNNKIEKIGITEDDILSYQKIYDKL